MVLVVCGAGGGAPWQEVQVVDWFTTPFWWSVAFTVVAVRASAVMVIGVSAALAQGGFYVATKSVKPTFSKLNPIAGVKRMVFSLPAYIEILKAAVKIAVVAVNGRMADLQTDVASDGDQVEFFSPMGGG